MHQLQQLNADIGMKELVPDNPERQIQSKKLDKKVNKRIICSSKYQSNMQHQFCITREAKIIDFTYLEKKNINFTLQFTMKAKIINF